MSNLTIDQKIEKTCRKIPLWKYWLISGLPSTILTIVPIIWSSPYVHNPFSANFIIVTAFAFAGLSMAYTAVLICFLQSTVDSIRVGRWLRLKMFGSFTDERIRTYLKRKGLGQSIAQDVSSFLPNTTNQIPNSDKSEELESRQLNTENDIISLNTKLETKVDKAEVENQRDELKSYIDRKFKVKDLVINKVTNERDESKRQRDHIEHEKDIEIEKLKIELDRANTSIATDKVKITELENRIKNLEDKK